jgi:hypothetical protein
VVVSRKVRYLAIAIGCLAAVVGSLHLSPGFGIVPSFLILGALTQPRFRHTGRVLMSAGAVALTFWMLLIGILPLPQDRYVGQPGLAALTIVSISLVVLCDLAIVVEEMKMRRGPAKRDAPGMSSETRWIAAITGCVTAITGLPIVSLMSVVVSGLLIAGAILAGRFPRHGRDLIWFGAGVTSLWAIPAGLGILSLSLNGGRDPRVVAAAALTVLLVVWCDAVLVTEAIGMRRTLRAGRAAND